jgi:hypothetical protein
MGTGAICIGYVLHLSDTALTCYKYWYFLTLKYYGV